MMRRLTGALAIIVAAIVALGAPAGAQDVIGEMTVDPASVPEAGEYEITATATGLVPDTQVLLSVCVSPADELVPGVSTEEDVLDAADMIGVQHCDIGNATQVSVDSDGGFTETVTVEIGPNTFVTAGDLAATQAAATWVPIVAEQPDELAETGAESRTTVLIGLALLALGGLAVVASRRVRLT